MINPKDIEYMGEAEKVVFLLAALNASETRADQSTAEAARTAADMAAMAASMSKEIENLKGQLEDAKKTLAGLVEQIKLANQQRFGSKSEKVRPDQLSLFNDMEAAADDSTAEPACEDILPTKPRRRGGRRQIDYSRLETVVIDHELDDAGRSCPECGHDMDEMSVEVTRRIRMVPAHLVVEEHRRHVYRCAACCADNADGGESKSVIVRAPQPKPPLPHSFATPSLIAWIVNGKYVNSLPLYRMEAELRSLGAPLSRQNMANWVMGCYERWFCLIYERMRAELMSHVRIHADETVVQVLREPRRAAERKSRMWLFCSARCDVPVYIFHYDETRSGSVACDFLAGWSGTLTTDGYKPYFNLGNPGVTNVACGVHIRRYFAKIVIAAGGDDKAATSQSVALEARRRMDRMFHIDSKFDGMEANERRAARDRELRPLMEDFLPWAIEQRGKASPKLALHRALDYAVTCWPYFMHVLDDGHLELSNNIAEQAQRIFVVGRKNWLFSNTPRGAEASAAVYSITTTAKANNLNPRLYVEWLLDKMPNAGALTDDIVDSLLPWSSAVPETCRLSPEGAQSAREFPDDPIVGADPDIENDEMENNRKEL